MVCVNRSALLVVKLKNHLSFFFSFLHTDDNRRNV